MEKLEIFFWLQHAGYEYQAKTMEMSERVWRTLAELRACAFEIFQKPHRN